MFTSRHLWWAWPLLAIFGVAFSLGIAFSFGTVGVQAQEVNCTEVTYNDSIVKVCRSDDGTTTEDPDDSFNSDSDTSDDDDRDDDDANSSQSDGSAATESSESVDRGDRGGRRLPVDEADDDALDEDEPDDDALDEDEPIADEPDEDALDEDEPVADSSDESDDEDDEPAETASEQAARTDVAVVGVDEKLDDNGWLLALTGGLFALGGLLYWAKRRSTSDGDQRTQE